MKDTSVLDAVECFGGPLEILWESLRLRRTDHAWSTPGTNRSGRTSEAVASTDPDEARVQFCGPAQADGAQGAHPQRRHKDLNRQPYVMSSLPLGMATAKATWRQSLQKAQGLADNSNQLLLWLRKVALWASIDSPGTLAQDANLAEIRGTAALVMPDVAIPTSADCVSFGEMLTG
jgi:hypothetical protein